MNRNRTWTAALFLGVAAGCASPVDHRFQTDLVARKGPEAAKREIASILERCEKPRVATAEADDNYIDYTVGRASGPLLRIAYSDVRDVVVSGGDVANLPWPRLESFLLRLLQIESIRDIRLATKALAALPQHWLQAKVVDGVHRVATTAAARGVNLALHTHINHVHSVTPLVAEATRVSVIVYR